MWSFSLNTMFNIFGWCLDMGNCGNQIMDKEIQLYAFKTAVGKFGDYSTICNSLDIEDRNDLAS